MASIKPNVHTSPPIVLSFILCKKYSSIKKSVFCLMQYWNNSQFNFLQKLEGHWSCHAWKYFTSMRFRYSMFKGTCVHLERQTHGATKSLPFIESRWVWMNINSKMSWYQLYFILRMAMWNPLKQDRLLLSNWTRLCVRVFVCNASKSFCHWQQ